MPPALHVDVHRGPNRESTHEVHAVVVDREGSVVTAWGDPDLVVLPRSSVKPVQAIPLVETGAADAFGLTDTELALACASHNGEAAHTQAVRAWLERIDCSPDDLECGVQAGRGDDAVGNNCSGKHAGFLTVARHLGVDPEGYRRAGHPVQALVTEILAAVAGVELVPDHVGVDGCGIPVHPVPLAALATAGARFGTPPTDWPPARTAAVRRLAAAMWAEPWMVAGTDRLCTDLLSDGPGEVLVKVGAEGVQLAAVLPAGIGIAVKCLDGAVRASEAALGHVLAEVERADRPEVFGHRAILRNHAGTITGGLAVREE